MAALHLNKFETRAKFSLKKRQRCIANFCFVSFLKNSIGIGIKSQLNYFKFLSNFVSFSWIFSIKWQRRIVEKKIENFWLIGVDVVG